jgi:hypothetical protein
VRFASLRCAPERAGGARSRVRRRSASFSVLAVLERILDDLLQRIEDRRVAADDAAAIVGRLRVFCAEAPPTPGGRTLLELRDALDPERFAERARVLARGYARLAAR